MFVGLVRARRPRRQSGSHIAEFPVAIWLLFIGLFFPLLMLAIVTFRANFLNMVAKEAAHAASKAQTFEDGTVEKPSAKTLATTAANQAASRFSGLKLNDIKTLIVQTEVANQNITVFENKLDDEADFGKNLYSIEVRVQGTLDPFLPVDIGMKVPGLNQPYPLTAVGREFAENPQGLNE